MCLGQKGHFNWTNFRQFSKFQTFSNFRTFSKFRTFFDHSDKMLSSARGFDTRNLKNVKTAFEHVSLYVGLIIYTAVGAMVGQIKASQIYLMHGQDFSSVWKIFFVNPHITRHIYGKTFKFSVKLTLQLHGNNTNYIRCRGLCQYTTPMV